MTEKGKNVFVFVVCGGRAHIETLHFSLQALKRFSANEIVIVTDTSRNEVPVVHDRIVDVNTPSNLDNHQASIFLKTGLHKFLPAENTYCYLDTDVVALSDNVDSIFDCFVAPITFATDHCRINSFSPSAVNCNCKKEFDADNEKLYSSLKYFDEVILPQLNYIDKCREEINKLVEESKKNKVGYFFRALTYYLPGKYYQLNAKYKMDKAEGRWYDDSGKLLWYEHKDNIRYASEQTGFRFDNENMVWYRANGDSLGELNCNHLVEAIHAKIGPAITPADWQHWNGGVFLFNAVSADFLECWHAKTLEIFADKYWKTRDQGTLAAMAWLFALQHQITLPIQYNFIADYNRASIKYRGGLSFSIGFSEQLVQPRFIHIYHHWGDENWAVWRDVKEHILKTHVA